MNSRTEERIVLISVHGDPAIEFGKEEAGGQNVYVRHVGESLAKLGWKVDMFTRKVNAKQDSIVEHSENCRTIRLKAGPTDFVPRDDIFDYLPDFVNNLLKFQQESGITYPLIHTNYWLSAWVGMELKKIQGSQQIHTYHSLGAVKYNTVKKVPLIAGTRLEVEKDILETAERIVATSPQEQEHMRSWVSSKGQINIIPCGTDIERFGRLNKTAARARLRNDPQAVKDGLKFEPQDKIIMYIGRFDRRKGIETLVRAVRNSKLFDSPNLKLIVAGGSRPGQSDGKERERIENIVDELGMRHLAFFPGRLSQEDLPIYYSAADVCVVPSHYEPFGLVAIEAMASGTPVVASDVGGLQFTVVPEETGLLAPPQDVEAFRVAIDRIISDSQWRDKLGQAGRKRVETKFSWDGVAHQLSDLYAEILQIAAIDSPSLISK